MAKTSIQYVCSSCGAKAPQMLGRCPVCGEWGTYVEEVVESGKSRVESGKGRGISSTQHKRLQEVVESSIVS